MSSEWYYHRSSAIVTHSLTIDNYKIAIAKMSDISWDILDEVNLKVAWRLVSKDMSKVFFNTRMVTVPHIEEVKYYDMMVCFTKKNVGMLDKLYQKLGLITIFMDMLLILLKF